MIFKITKNADEMFIKQSYLKLVKKYHSDIHQENQTGNEDKMKEINYAYSILKSDEQRSSWLKNNLPLYVKDIKKYIAEDIVIDYNSRSHKQHSEDYVNPDEIKPKSKLRKEDSIDHDIENFINKKLKKDTSTTKIHIQHEHFEDRKIKRQPIKYVKFKNGEPIVDEDEDYPTWHGFFKRYRKARPIPFTQIQNSGHYRNVFYRKNYDTFYNKHKDEESDKLK